MHALEALGSWVTAKQRTLCYNCLMTFVALRLVEDSGQRFPPKVTMLDTEVTSG